MSECSRWNLLNEDANVWECPECGAAFTLIENTPEWNRYYFCPRCGTRLIEEADNGNV